MEEETKQISVKSGLYLKKRTILIISGSIFVFFVVLILATYFGKSCSVMKTESIADKVINCQSLVCQHKSIYDGKKCFIQKL